MGNSVPRFTLKHGPVPPTAYHPQGGVADPVRIKYTTFQSYNTALPSGFVNNVTVRKVRLDRVNAPIHVYQTNGGHTSVVISSALDDLNDRCF